MTSCRFLLLASIVAILTFCVSCTESGPPRITVKGKITFAGGDWPKPVTFDFAAIKPAEGMPNLPAPPTEIKPDGSFETKLVPGEYAINITCWEIEPAPDDPSKAKSYVPKRYQDNKSPDRLKVDVPLGSKGPITVNLDVAKQ